jgi:hypothetical protein
MARSLDAGVDGAHLDTADTGSIDGSELDVAINTPGGAPGVLDEPVVLSVLVTVADGEDGVVECGSASFGVEDTGGVGLEDVGVSLDRDGDGLSSKGSLEGGNGVGADLVGAGDLDLGVGIFSIVRAGTVLGSVGVGSLARGVVRFVVAEGKGLVSTVATEACMDTVDELLLGDGEEISGLDPPLTFEGTSGGEAPAGTALTLVLDGGDGTIINPVDSGSEGGGGVGGGGRNLLDLGVL